MSKKLHILFLSGWYPSRVLKYNGDFIQRHAEAVSLKNKVSALHIISDKNCKKNIEYSLETINDVSTYIAYIKPSKNPIKKGYRFYIAFKNLLKSIENFDIVHLNILFPFGLFALYLKWFQKKPFIISEHWTRYLYPNSKNINLIEKVISKITAKNASFICPVSNNLTTSMKNIGLSGNYKVVGNVVNTDLFFPSRKKNKTFTILHISSLTDVQKNISGMLRVAKQLENKIDNFTWQFIGGSSKKYEKLISDLNFKKANIEFINHIRQKELTTYLQQANLYVSFSNFETFGIVMIESLACGTPVISTKTGILTEFDKKDTFKIISIKNETELYNSILEFKEKKTPINRHKIHTYISENFSKKAISSQFSELYYKSLKNKT